MLNTEKELQQEKSYKQLRRETGAYVCVRDIDGMFMYVATWVLILKKSSAVQHVSSN